MKHPANKIFYLLLIIVIGIVTYYLGSVLVPFVIAFILAYIATPLVRKLEKHRVPHLLAVILAFLIVLTIFVVLCLSVVPFIHNQIVILNQSLPKMIDWFQVKVLPVIQPYIGGGDDTSKLDLKSYVKENFISSNAVMWTLQTVLKSGQKIFEVFMYVILIPVMMFYMLRDWDAIAKKLLLLVPKANRSNFVKVVKECESVLGSFVRGQLIVITALSIIYALGLKIVGLQLGVTIGIVMGILSFVPFLGLLVGVVIASIAALMQFGTLNSLIAVWVVIIIGHVLDNIFLTPSLLGESIGLHPVLVIFAILAGGALLGFVGVLLALPVAAMCKVILQHLYKTYYQHA